MPARKPLQPGETLGHLTVIEAAPSYKAPSGVSHPRVRCRCSCGKEVVTSEYRFRRGEPRSCGCQRAVSARKFGELKRTNLVGRRFGRLVVVAWARRTKSGDSLWRCHCDCGNFVEVAGGNLKKKPREIGELLGGKICNYRAAPTRSCGCLKADVTRARSKLCTGAAHQNWRHDLSFEDRQARKYRSVEPGYLLARFCVLYRHGYRCQCCGKEQRAGLHIHHIKSWANFPNHRTVNWNMVPLCNKCHRDFHRKYGQRKLNYKSFIPWLRENRRLNKFNTESGENE